MGFMECKNGGAGGADNLLEYSKFKKALVQEIDVIQYSILWFITKPTPTYMYLDT